MKKKLEKGEVNFTFKTVKDGKMRPARGTLNPKLIKASGGKVPRPSKAKNVQTESTNMTYFDLGVGEWRSFRFANLKTVK